MVRMEFRRNYSPCFLQSQSVPSVRFSDLVVFTTSELDRECCGHKLSWSQRLEVCLIINKQLYFTSSQYYSINSIKSESDPRMLRTKDIISSTSSQVEEKADKPFDSMAACCQVSYIETPVAMSHRAAITSISNPVAPSLRYIILLKAFITSSLVRSWPKTTGLVVTSLEFDHGTFMIKLKLRLKRLCCLLGSMPAR